uniref:Uncharacterized protein n=1 Tax=Setaria italica TaxID=4555 RepID=K3Z009_SETIT
MRAPQQPNPTLYLPHPKICLLSPLPNHEHRKKKKFNLRSSLSHSRVILMKTLETPRITSARRDLRYLLLLPTKHFSRRP